MTPVQIALARALKHVSGLSEKSRAFVSSMEFVARTNSEKEISAAQNGYLLELAVKFKRQMPKGLIEDETGAKQPYRTLQWLGPEIARKGLLVNDDWVTAASDQAEKMFPASKAMTNAAVIWAAMDRYALDYLKQCPILLLAATRGVDVATVVGRNRLMNEIGAKLKSRPKLRDLMREYSIVQPLRSIDSRVISMGHYGGFLQLTHVNPSTLAQIIPNKPMKTARWLSALASWDETLARRFDAVRFRFCEWAATRFVGAEFFSQYMVADLADFIGAVGDQFNVLWTLEAASERARRWQEDLRLKSSEEQFFARNGFKWTDQIDYGKMPTEFEYGDLRVVALRSGADIFEEGCSMHHCVASYTQAVLGGRCRLFSVRDRHGGRLATVEFGTDWLKKTWQIVQARGPCNAQIRSAEVMKAIAAFGSIINVAT